MIHSIIHPLHLDLSGFLVGWWILSFFKDEYNTFDEFINLIKLLFSLIHTFCFHKKKNSFFFSFERFKPQNKFMTWLQNVKDHAKRISESHTNPWLGSQSQKAKNLKNMERTKNIELYWRWSSLTFFFFFINRRNDKSLKIHTHKVDESEFEFRSWRLTITISTFLSIKLKLWAVKQLY
jgi:hypothetical protein